MASRSNGPTDPASFRRRQALGRLGALPFLLAACGRDPAEAILAAGKPLPALTLPDLQGQAMGLAAPGRPCLVNFWATWCPPCRAEMGGLEGLHRRFGAAGLLVQGVSVDGDANLVREFILRQGLGFPMLWDRAGRVTQETLGIRSFPTTVLVRRDGLIADVAVGERDWEREPALNAVRALL